MAKENNKSYVQRKKMLLNVHLIGKLHDEEIVKVYKNFILFLRAADQDRAKKKLLLDGLDWLSYLARYIARKNEVEEL